jgi:hypothetical protein
MVKSKQKQAPVPKKQAKQIQKPKSAKISRKMGVK